MDTEEIDLSSKYGADCPSRTIIDILANKWSLYVLGLLDQRGEPLRFTQLRRSIGGITQKSLTQSLRALERDGLLSRKVYPVIPPRVEYTLTELGKRVAQLMSAVTDWAVENAFDVLQSRKAFDERAALVAQPDALHGGG